MNQLVADKELFEFEIKETIGSIITYLRNKTGISYKEQICFNDETIIASYVYSEKGIYKLVYTHIDRNGNCLGNYIEEGILPTLFESPDKKVWVSVITYHPDKEQEISIPLFDRANYISPKPNRPFVGDFVGTTANASLFLNVDLFSSTKPDKLLCIEFKNETIKKKHNLKIELPGKNKISIINNEIHLLAKVDGGLLHRQIAQDTSLIRQRSFYANTDSDYHILFLSFTENSTLIANRKNTFYLLTIDDLGNSTERELINVGSDIYSVWSPQRIATKTFLLRFTIEGASGWIVIRDDSVLECFIQTTDKGYKNILDNELIDLGYDDLILSGANKTIENSYTLTFYPRPKENNETNMMIILNRQLK